MLKRQRSVSAKDSTEQANENVANSSENASNTSTRQRSQSTLGFIGLRATSGLDAYHLSVKDDSNNTTAAPESKTTPYFGR